MSVFLYFIVYSFIGWVIDTGVRSYVAGRYLPGSFFRAPFCPSYGVGALIIIEVSRLLAEYSIAVELVIYGLMLALFEYATGEFMLRVFHRRLWVYQSGWLNLGGFTNALHAFLWGVLGIFLVHILHPALQAIRIAIMH